MIEGLNVVTPLWWECGVESDSPFQNSLTMMSQGSQQMEDHLIYLAHLFQPQYTDWKR